MPQEHVKNTIFIGVDDENSGALPHWCVGLAFFCKTTCICQNHRRFGIKSAKKKWIGKQWSLIWKFFPAHHNTPKKKNLKPERCTFLRVWVLEMVEPTRQTVMYCQRWVSTFSHSHFKMAACQQSLERRGLFLLESCHLFLQSMFY